MSQRQARPGVAIIELGSKFRYNGDQWTVVGMDGPTLRVRSPRGLAILLVSDVATHAEFLGTDDDVPGIDDFMPMTGIAAPASLVTSVATPQVLKTADNRVRLVNLLLTGFDDGILRTGIEPSPFGPAGPGSFKDRLSALAKAETVGVRSLERWVKNYQDNGIAGLVDKRSLAISDPLGTCPAEVREALVRVVAARLEKSKVTDKELVRQVKESVRKTHGADFTYPSDRSMHRYLEVVKDQYSLHLSTRTLQGNALRPNKTWRPVQPTRPFELVEIDSTPLDVFAISQIDGKPTTVTLTAAIDIYTRAPVAWQFSGGEAKSVDATMLIHDILAPKPLNPEWDELAAWRFGIPESVVLHAFDATGPIAGVPFGPPSTLSLDNGAMYVSETARSACARLGINLQYARTARPTDKPHIERFFGTVRTQFLEKLPGYKGHSVATRGTTQNVEGAASLFIWEIESLFAEWVATIYMNTPHGGLRVPDVRGLELTPAEAFNRGIAMSGFYAVPVTPDLAISLLPATSRVVGRQGIEVEGLMYNDDSLDPYRNKKSPFPDLNGRWPIRYDDRDRSSIWFWAGNPAEPTTGQWERISCNVLEGNRPFADVELEYVKSLFTDADRAASRHQNTEILARALEQYLRRIDNLGPANRKEARVAAIGRDRATQAAKVGHAITAPSDGLPHAVSAETVTEAATPNQAVDDIKHTVANVTQISEDDFFSDEDEYDEAGDTL